MTMFSAPRTASTTAPGAESAIMTTIANEQTSAFNKVPVAEALTKPVAAKITAPSAALAAADALLEAPAVENLSS